MGVDSAQGDAGQGARVTAPLGGQGLAKPFSRNLGGVLLRDRFVSAQIPASSLLYRILTLACGTCETNIYYVFETFDLQGRGGLTHFYEVIARARCGHHSGS